MRIVKASAALAAVALTAAAAACGGTGRTPDSALGQTVFRQSCAACHSLAGHEIGASGGDLAVPSLSVAVLASFATAMPGTDRLSRADALAVARYVRRAEAAAARR